MSLYNSNRLSFRLTVSSGLLMDERFPIKVPRLCTKSNFSLVVNSDYYLFRAILTVVKTTSLSRTNWL